MEVLPLKGFALASGAVVKGCAVEAAVCGLL